jgi:integrase
MANTGLRKPEARNLRWRDIGKLMTGKDGRPFLPISVRGKGKFRMLVAAATVSTYVERIRELSKATGPDDFVFTTFEGKRNSTLYESLLLDILSEKETNLLLSAAGKRRNTTSLRHTYATFRLMFGTDPLTLAAQMGTSVKMIQEHYSHVQVIKNPDLILKGLPGWELMDGAPASGVNADAVEAKAKPGKAKRQEKASPTAG